jgi:hypothetical protein
MPIALEDSWKPQQFKPKLAALDKGVQDWVGESQAGLNLHTIGVSCLGGVISMARIFGDSLECCIDERVRVGIIAVSKVW